MEPCSLSTLVFCHPDRFCPHGGRSSCPGHVVPVCDLPAAWRFAPPDGSADPVRACEDHRLEVAGRHPGWEAARLGHDAYTVLASDPGAGLVRAICGCGWASLALPDSDAAGAAHAAHAADPGPGWPTLK